MAAPQFSTSHAKHASRPRPRFTLEQANRSLPLVRRIVRDIVNTHEQATQLQAKLDEAASPKAAKAVQEQLDAAMARLQSYVEELGTVGVELKDYGTGLIDFRGRHQGREVYLCWKLGEEKIAYWHELHTGFAGRQPIATLAESESE
jgi:hypothetical protein